MPAPVFIWAADAPLALLLARDLEVRDVRTLLLSTSPPRSEQGSEHGSHGRVAVVDSGEPSSFVEPIAAAVEEWGPPGGLALLPPSPPARPFHEVEVGEWTRDVYGALHAVVLLLRAALPAAALENGGRVVTVLPAQPAPPPHRRGGRSAGDTLRAALTGLVHALAGEPAGRHARWFTVQGAAPGEDFGLDQAPPEARRDGPPATAALVAWLLTSPAARLPNTSEISVRAARG
jgi:NAD(P)-dependent dehydrogenase (short-subunit alcohol dehydrogenase family)